MQPTSGKPVLTNSDNFVNQNRTHSNKQNTGKSSKIDWSTYGAGFGSGILTTIGSYYTYNTLTAPSPTPSYFSTDTSSTTYLPQLLTGLFLTAVPVVAWCMKDSCVSVNRESKLIRNINSAKNNAVIDTNIDEIKPVIVDTKPKTPAESLQEWWNLAEDFQAKGGMPNLSEVEILILYNIFENSQLKNNSIINMRNNGDVIEVEFKTQSDIINSIVYTDLGGGQKVPLRSTEFKRLFGGFILSQKTSYFAVADGMGRGNFLIYKNKNGKIGQEGLIGFSTGIPICTREGLVAPSEAEWKIGKDNVCRLVNKDALIKKHNNVESTFSNVQLPSTKSNANTNTNWPVTPEEAWPKSVSPTNSHTNWNVTPEEDTEFRLENMQPNQLNW